MIEPPETVEIASTFLRIPRSASRASTPRWKNAARKPPPERASPSPSFGGGAAVGSESASAVAVVRLTIPPERGPCQPAQET